MKRPFRQGYFDGLCGLYSALNACNNLVSIKEEEKDKLFRKCIEHMSRVGSLQEYIINGITINRLGGILNVLEEEIKKNKGVVITHGKFNHKGNVNIVGYWNILSDYLKDNKDCVAIIGINGYMAHWSCAVDIDDKKIILCDSGGLKTIDRATAKVSKYDDDEQRLILRLDEIIKVYLNSRPPCYLHGSRGHSAYFGGGL